MITHKQRTRSFPSKHVHPLPLPGTQFQRFLDLVKQCPDSKYTATVSSYDEKIESTRKQMCGEGFQTIDIAPELNYTEGPLLLVMRRDHLGDFLRHAGAPSRDNTFPLNFTMLRDPKTGERLYNEFCSADRWREMELEIAKYTGQDAPKIVFYNKVAYDGSQRHTGHPITLSCGEHC